MKLCEYSRKKYINHKQYRLKKLIYVIIIITAAIK